MIRFYVLLLISIVILQACEQKPKEQRYIQPELEVWFHYRSEMGQKVLLQQIASFNQLQSGVRINAVILPREQYHQQLTRAANRRQLPDLFEIGADYIGHYASKGYLLPIDKIITDNVRGDLFPQLITPNIYQGHLYAVSLNSKINLLFIRRSALEAIGISPLERSPWSMRRFFEVVDSLHEHYGDTNIFDINSVPENFFEVLLPMLEFSAGKSGSERSLEAVITGLDHPDNIEFFKFLQREYQQKRAGANDVEITRSIMTVGTQADIARNRRQGLEEMVVLPLPSRHLSSPVLYNGWSMAINKDCKNTQSASRFIEFLLQPEQQLASVNADHFLPSTYSAIGDINNKNKDINLGRADVGLYVETFHSASAALPGVRQAFSELILALFAGKDVVGTVARTKEKMIKILKVYHESADEAIREN